MTSISTQARPTCCDNMDIERTYLDDECYLSYCVNCGTNFGIKCKKN